MPRVGFEPTISADERPKTYALDRAATGTGTNCVWFFKCVQGRSERILECELIGPIICSLRCSGWENIVNLESTEKLRFFPPET